MKDRPAGGVSFRHGSLPNWKDKPIRGQPVLKCWVYECRDGLQSCITEERRTPPSLDTIEISTPADWVVMGGGFTMGKTNPSGMTAVEVLRNKNTKMPNKIRCKASQKGEFTCVLRACKLPFGSKCFPADSSKASANTGECKTKTIELNKLRQQDEIDKVTHARCIKALSQRVEEVCKTPNIQECRGDYVMIGQSYTAKWLQGRQRVTSGVEAQQERIFSTVQQGSQGMFSCRPLRQTL